MIVIMSNQSSYLREVRESQKVFSALVIEMEKSHKLVIAEIEDRQRQEDKRVETLVKELKQEIQELQRDTDASDPQISLNGDEKDEKNQDNLVSILIYMMMTIMTH